MRRYRLRSILALIALIGLSLWVGMQIERARSAPRVTYHTYRPRQTGKTNIIVRSVRPMDGARRRP
jgi:hypothetical protein